MIKKITCTSCRDWVFEFPNTQVKLTNSTCHKDNYPLMRVKVMLGIADVEEEKLLDRENLERESLI